jgi:hypothetical protein
VLMEKLVPSKLPVGRAAGLLLITGGILQVTR